MRKAVAVFSSSVQEVEIDSRRPVGDIQALESGTPSFYSVFKREIRIQFTCCWFYTPSLVDTFYTESGILVLSWIA